MPSVQLGIDRLLCDHGLVAGERWGLITNYTGVTSELELSSVALHRSGAPLVALLSPEHGLQGTAQAGESEASGSDPRTGLPVLDTYLLSDEALDAAIRALDVDALVVDIQDIGVRYYTYVWTMVDCLRSAARLGIPFHVLDRPNPLGGNTVSGPGVEPGFESFVGRLDVPMRHGLTIGEIARVAAQLDRDAGHDVPEPNVVEMRGWRRDMLWADTGLEWIMPSPNMPTPLTALVYVGTALFEGTSLSEGRGTTRPFELIGAPWIGDRYVDELNRRGLAGVRFRSTSFMPTFSKWQGQAIGGVQLHLQDARSFDPLLTATTMLVVAQQLYPADFAWREPMWENGVERPHFVDLLWGGPKLRGLVETADTDAIVRELERASGLRERDSELLLYEEKDGHGR
ncbi:exo-beta-N-acetylmuramidase NamZ family protein [Tessaracoccus oleiagri]|uniref:Uncharacterized conserved protein YbbC, DUF1343 family n=1 Tax=Tessaracoccus oleiagri TaxID=686624 RepID=A0A1G9HZZ0_9ACTN|nr:DUF1343 domain-containing protein [Tessaracoccus oleiagri]SDL18133.1 Uncharacterized conserved protein YbbC, DUF1343 family [Tessaracoccus oleiagri]